MLNEEDLVQRYPDLLDGETDPELVRLVGQLDEASAAYHAVEPPDALIAAIDQLASDRVDHRSWHPRVHVPRGFAAAQQPPKQPGRPIGKLRNVLSNRPRWLHQSTELAAGILALVLFTGLFVTLLSIYGGGGHTLLSDQTLSPKPGASPVAHMTALDLDSEARQAYDAGLGKQLNLVQSAGDFTVTLNWAYADGSWIDIYYTINYPADRKLTSVELWKLEVSAADGSILPSRGGSTFGDMQGTVSSIQKFDLSEIRATTGTALLHLQSPGIYALVQNDSFNPFAASPSPAATAEYPASGCQPNQRLCPLNVPGPFGFDFTVPYQPEPPASPPAHIPVTMDKAIKQVRTFLGEPDAKLSGRYVDTAIAKPNRTIFFPPRPNAKLWVVTRNWKNGADPDTFIVDAETGEVLKAAIPSRVSNDASRKPITNQQAEAIAENFARAHYPGFDQMKRSDGDPAVTDTQYLLSLEETRVKPPPALFSWALRSPSTDGEIPAFISVGVDAKTGAVVQYLAHPAGNRPEPGQPLITRERAMQIALDETRKEPQNTDARVSKITLDIERGTDDQGLLMWVVDLTGTKPAPPIPSIRPPGETISGYNIDARTGEIGQYRSKIDEPSPRPGAASPAPS